MRGTFITCGTAGMLALAGCSEPVTTPTGAVDLVESVTLTAPAGSADLQGSAPARSAAGYYAARTFAGRGGGIAVFDSAGDFVVELKAQGRGPGEFSDLQGVGFGPGDTLWAVERTRAHAFSPPPQLQCVRVVDFGSVTQSGVTTRGFLARGVFTGEGIQAPALRDWDGRVLARFTLPNEIASVEAQMGPVTLARDGSLWFGHGARYELVRIDARGGDVRWVRRVVDWFPPDRKYEGALNVVRPPARLQMLATDGEDRLLVVSRRAHPNWTPMNSGPATVERKSTQPAPAEAARARPSLADWGKLFEFVLEIFDANGQLVATRVLDDGMQGLVDGTQVYQVVADSVGVISLRLWNIRVSDGSAGR